MSIGELIILSVWNSELNSQNRTIFNVSILVFMNYKIWIKYKYKFKFIVLK